MMNKRYLYIVLTETNTVISRLIKRFKNDKYTHASIALDKDLNYMYSFGRKYVRNPFIGRFNRETVDNGIFKLQKEVPCIVLELEVSEKQYEKARYLLGQFISNSHQYKYNYKGLLHNLFNIEAYEEDRFLCSEFVYHILKESGVVDFKMSRNLVRPQSLLVLKSNIIYKGNLKHLKQKRKDHAMGEGFSRVLSAVCEQ